MKNNNANFLEYGLVYVVYLFYLCKQNEITMEVAINEPNEVTKAAMEEARSGKLRDVPPVDTSSVEAMFKSTES